MRFVYPVIFRLHKDVKPNGEIGGRFQRMGQNVQYREKDERGDQILGIQVKNSETLNLSEETEVSRTPP